MLRIIRRILGVFLGVFILTSLFTLSNQSVTQSINAEEYDKRFQNYMGDYLQVASRDFGKTNINSKVITSFMNGEYNYIDDESPEILAKEIVNEYLLSGGESFMKNNLFTTYYDIVNDDTFILRFTLNQSKPRPTEVFIDPIQRQLSNQLFLKSVSEESGTKSYFYFPEEFDGLVYLTINDSENTLSTSIFEKTFTSPYANTDFDNINYEEYNSVNYIDVMRDRNLEGSDIIVTGEVLQYHEAEDNPKDINVLILENGDLEKVFHATFKLFPNQRLVKGDNVTIYGEFIGVKNHTTLSDTKIIAPTISIDKHLIEGIDY